MPDPVQSQHAALPLSSNPNYPAGSFAPVAMDPTTGGLKVVIAGGGGSGGTSASDGATFTAGTTAGTPAMGVVNPADTPTTGDLAVVALDSARNLKVNVVAGGAGGGAVTVANGADVAQGSTTDAAVVGDVAGTISAKLRGLSKILNNVWSSANSWLQVSIQNATLAVTQSTSPWVENVSQFGGANVVTGTGASGVGIPRVTVSSDSVIQPGNTANTTPWLVTPTPTAGQGWSPSFNAAVTTSVKQIKGTTATLGGWFIWNPNTTVSYVQIFNLASASVTLGTSVPVLSLPIPPQQGANLMGDGIAFSTALSFGCTTTASGNTAPATGLDCNFFYL